MSRRGEASVGMLKGEKPDWVVQKLTELGAARITLQRQIIALAFMIVAIVRAWPNFNSSNPATWIFTVGLVCLLVALIEEDFHALAALESLDNVDEPQSNHSKARNRRPFTNGKDRDKEKNQQSVAQGKAQM